MTYTFTEEALNRIGDILGVGFRWKGPTAIYNLADVAGAGPRTLEIVTSLSAPRATKGLASGNLVTVKYPTGWLQLQNCTGVTFEDHGREVLFFARRGATTSVLTIDHQAWCSLYANFDSQLASADYQQISTDLIMGSAVLSLNPEAYQDRL